MSLSTIHGSSLVSSLGGAISKSEYQKAIAISRDGGLCVLCGIGAVDVAHVIARNSADCRQVDWIRQVAPSLSDFRRDDAFNLICLCPHHHREFESGYFVFVPSRRQRESMLEHELRNFAMREGIIARGGRDPGRSFPEHVDEFEYISVQGPFQVLLHNPTEYDPENFIFDNADRPCPLLHFRACNITLMVEAEPHLSTVQSLKGGAALAEQQITTLLRLYRRQPEQHSDLIPTISLPENYKGCSSSVSTIVLAQAEDADDELCADTQLMEYAKERSITWEDLKNRPPVFGGQDVGHWRFASADDICRRM